MLVNGPFKRAAPLPKGTQMMTIDLDGTVAYTLPRVLEIWAREGGRIVKPSEITDYNIRRFLRYQNGDHISVEHLTDLFRKVWSEPERIELRHRNAKGILSGAFGGWHQRLLTSTVGTSDNVLRFLEANQIFFDDIEMVKTEQEKIAAAGRIHLDDNLATARAIAKEHKYSFVLDSSYAKGFRKISPYLFLVSDWPHFGRMVLSGAYLRNEADIPGFKGTCTL